PPRRPLQLDGGAEEPPPHALHRRCLLQQEEHGHERDLELPPRSRGQRAIDEAPEGPRRQARRRALLLARPGDLSERPEGTGLLLLIEAPTSGSCRRRRPPPGG